MARPLIGLTTYAEQAQFGMQDTFSAVLPLRYVQAVHESGGRALLITPDAPDPEVLEALDGIVFTGGSDVDPALYGEEPLATTHIRPERDAAEILLLRAALETELPILGICRGMQLMAAAYGGRLYQHLPDVLGHHGHRPVSGPKFGEHPVHVTPGSLAHSYLGENLTVNSFHHQGVADPGRLTPVGWCPADDLIEVVEDAGREFTIGVQWHPEDTTDFRIIAALVAAAADRRTRV